MDKVKYAFVPMSYAEFEQRFTSHVICKNGRLPEADKNTFVGKYSDGHFVFALYGSEFLMKVNVVPSGAGIMLKYRFKIRPLVWVVFAMFIVVVTLLFFTVSSFDMIFLILIGIRYVIMLGLFIFGIVSIVRNRRQHKIRLYQKLDEICCGMLQEGGETP